MPCGARRPSIKLLYALERVNALRGRDTNAEKKSSIRPVPAIRIEPCPPNGDPTRIPRLNKFGSLINARVASSNAPAPRVAANAIISSVISGTVFCITANFDAKAKRFALPAIAVAPPDMYEVGSYATSPANPTVRSAIRPKRSVASEPVNARSNPPPDLSCKTCP